MNLAAVLTIIVLLTVDNGFAFDSYEDYFDPVLYYLLNGTDMELSELRDEDNEVLNVGSEPLFLDGIWKCGNCSDVDETKVIYNEINDVDTDIVDDNFLQVQVGLAFDEMRCVTIQSDKDCEVKRIAGGCLGPTVTLLVTNAEHFDVKVYAE